MTKLFIERVSKNALVPTKATTYSAGFDIHCDIQGRMVRCMNPKNQPYDVHTLTEPFYLQPNHRAIIPTGWKMRCAEDEAIEFHPRSGLSFKVGITMINCMGLIDADYPDETGLILTNLSEMPFKITHGERLGQLMVRKLHDTVIEEVDELPAVVSNRVGGFGSSGTSALEERTQEEELETEYRLDAYSN